MTRFYRGTAENRNPLSMSQTFLLIDFENIREVALSSISAEYRVIIFVGKSQNSIPFTITSEAQKLGERLQWIKIEGDGRNNLDFHLAFYLGRLSTKHAESQFLVLSKDRGFDPVIRHALSVGVQCSRVESLAGVATAVPAIADPHFQKAFKVLSGTEKKGRPRKRKTLEAQIASFFQKESPDEIQRIVNVFFERNLITETDNALTYNF